MGNDIFKQKGIDASHEEIAEFIQEHRELFHDFIKSLSQKQSKDSAGEIYGQQEAIIEEKANSTLTIDPEPLSGKEQQDREVVTLSEESKEAKAQNEELAFQIKNKQITFLNGKVGQDYCVDFDFEKLGISEIAEVDFEGLEKIGLRYSPDEKKIKGTPIQAGDHKIEMHFKRKDWEEGKPLLPREGLFIINPDPRDLWSKNIPTPENVEYYKPDSDKKFIKTLLPKADSKNGNEKEESFQKNIVAASQRGRSHAIEGKPRDDDFRLHFDEETGWYVMVVADGAGSANYSRKGSQIACQTTVKVCIEKLAAKKEDLNKLEAKSGKNELEKIVQEIICHAVFQACKAIETEAKEQGRTIKEYSTTLLVSLCRKFDYGWFVGAWWVGDGGIGIYCKETEYLKILGEPDGGEYAGQTRFLTMPEIMQQKDLYGRFRIDIVKDFTALILMTDGITDPKFETDANLNRIEKWHELWDDLNGNNEDQVKVNFTDISGDSAEQLLNWLNFWSRGNHDDRTIAILC